MPLLTISDAARLCGVDRRTLQRAIQAGRLTLTPEHRLDTADLRRAGYAVPVSQLDPAPTPQGTPRETPQETPRDASPTPQELPLVTALLAHLEQLTRTIVALHQEVILLREDLRQTPQRRRGSTPQETLHGTPQDAAPMSHYETFTPQETPQETPHDAAPVAEMPQADTASMPHHAALTPQDVAETPRATSQEPATLEVPPAPLTPHLQRIAEIAAEYHRMSLAELAQLLFDRGIYRAKDRTTGAAVPVNRGTLGRWLTQARQAGLLERSVTSASPHD
jgi:hypothetical protein